MQFLANLKILTKVALVILVLVVISGTVSVATYNSGIKQTQSAQWSDHTYKVLMTLESLMAAMVNQETGMRGYVIAGDGKFLEPQLAGAAAFADNLTKLRQLTADNPVQQKRLDDVEALARQWATTVVEPEKKFMQDPSTIEQARKIEISGVGKISMDAIRAKIQEMSAAEAGLLVTRAAEASESAANAQFVTIAGGISMAVVALLGLLLLNLSVVRGIRGLNGAMLKLANGELATDVPMVGRKDEVGQMASALTVFKQAALENQRLEQQADASRREAEAERIRITAQSEAAAQERLDKATSGLAQALQRLADGDLSFQITEVFSPEFEALRANFNTAVSQLQQALQGVVQTAEVIDTGSRELSQSANDLSHRTEQQAAALEQTAAALDEITTNVTNSNRLAQEARNVAGDANRAASESGRVVASAVEAMQRIEQSSSQISSIIGVIDEIAFQTNLLALNAGVEAARAGEAGKGFAVVAQEVRELAQRSASAAKEIKDLIGKSSMEVSGGVKLVQATGEALKTIEAYVSTVNEHMESIATSAQEQSAGLAQVNSAVNQMDQTTQKNAAMVEESNAASASLVDEANNLRGMMQRFRLGSGHTQHRAGAVDLPLTAHQPASPARRMMASVAKAFGA